MSNSKLRDQIFKSDDTIIETVVVEEWGTKVAVKSLSGRERAAVLKANASLAQGEMDIDNFYSSLLIATVVDPETGEKVFTEDDAEAIKDRNGAALEKIAKVALKLGGLTEEAVEEAGKESSLPTIPNISPRDASTSS